MAGFPVAEAWLMALKGEERDIVLAELEIRKQGFGGSPAPPIAAVVSGGRPLTGAAKKAAEAKAARAAAADHIQAAATTAMVGEE
jgi:hypothetical protein